ncbi:hypothetical protein Tco_1258168, partial [Tanacetum coccineum]
MPPDPQPTPGPLLIGNAFNMTPVNWWRNDSCAIRYRLIEEMSDSPNSSMDQSPISYLYCQTNSETKGEDENVEDVQMADHLRPMEELLQIPIV